VGARIWSQTKHAMSSEIVQFRVSSLRSRIWWKWGLQTVGFRLGLGFDQVEHLVELDWSLEGVGRLAGANSSVGHMNSCLHTRSVLPPPKASSASVFDILVSGRVSSLKKVGVWVSGTWLSSHTKRFISSEVVQSIERPDTRAFSFGAPSTENDLQSVVCVC